MANVYNWHLGREMSYRFDEAHPDWQFAFVFNINRCLACQTCTMACKSTWTFSEGQEYMWWTNVETKPYGGYPQGWDVKILELLEQANPGGQVWDTSKAGPGKPYGEYKGMTIFQDRLSEEEINIDPGNGINGRNYLHLDVRPEVVNKYADLDKRTVRVGNGQGINRPFPN